MTKPKIAFLCHFSSEEIRKRLDLNRYNLRKFLYGLKGGAAMYDDFAIWVSDYIAEFEKHPEIEFHIVAPHYGMKKDLQEFEKNGIHYHFFRWNYGIVYSLIEKIFNLYERSNFKRNRKKMTGIIKKMDPDLVVLCGAENPYYSIGVLDIQDKPVYVILQTLLNDPARIEMGVGTPYKRKIELDIFSHAKYFCAYSEKAVAKIREQNANAVFLPARFPTHQPVVTIPPHKEYDFVFFARGVSKNKGIEDLLQALAIVKKNHSDVLLYVIGDCVVEYKRQLEELIEKLGVLDNVVFAGYFLNIQDTFNHVVKAKNVVVPGITAGLNSTVRESMFMGLPTICYETNMTKPINNEKTCLLTARMGDIGDLAKKMQYALEKQNEMEVIGTNGKDYANKTFSNEPIVNELLSNCRHIIEKKF